MIQQNLRAIHNQIGHSKLIVVSKYRSIEELNAVYACGERAFAENRVQELLKKRSELPADIDWHLIGHLQTNKVKQVIPFVTLIHSVDSIKLLDEIEKEASKIGRTIHVLLQVHVAQDESKFGFDTDALMALANENAFTKYQMVVFKGIMSMSTLNASGEQVASEFSQTYSIFQSLKPLMPNPADFSERSYGMSGDYNIAIDQNSTMVRIGSKIFE